MYRFYRKLASGKWKYTETFMSTLDPSYHGLINHCNDEDIEWKLTTTDGIIKFKSKE